VWQTWHLDPPAAAAAAAFVFLYPSFLSSSMPTTKDSRESHHLLLLHNLTSTHFITSQAFHLCFSRKATNPSFPPHPTLWIWPGFAKGQASLIAFWGSFWGLSFPVCLFFPSVNPP
jgi:hypothetical protein